MQDGGVCARGNNRRVGRAVRAVAAEMILEQSFDFVFVHTRSRLVQGRMMGRSGRLDRLTHQVDFLRGFEQAHFVQQVTGINKRDRPAPEARALQPALVHKVQNFCVETFVAAKSVVDFLCGEQVFGQHLVEFINRISGIHAKIFPCALHAKAFPGPGFFVFITRTHKQDEPFLVVVGREQAQGFRFGETGQVVQVVVLAIAILDILGANGSRGRGKNGYPVTHLFQKRLPADCIGRKIRVHWHVTVSSLTFAQQFKTLGTIWHTNIRIQSP